VPVVADTPPQLTVAPLTYAFVEASVTTPVTVPVVTIGASWMSADTVCPVVTVTVLELFVF
jgi:hypothetical protein